jgi:LPS export ABC transporter protein LptC
MLQAVFLLFSSCTKEKEVVSGKLHSDEDPRMSAGNIEVLFSDSGRIQAKLTAPILNEYMDKNPRMDFPRGFRVIMYDSAMRVKSSITALYGIRVDYRGYMEVRGNVVVRNELKNEQLNTEHLIWDQRLHRIYNNDPIKIITPGKVLYGNDLESDEAFTQYTFKNPSGHMLVRKDSV